MRTRRWPLEGGDGCALSANHGRNCSVRKPDVDGGAGGRDRLTRNSARRDDIARTNETPAV